jgi:glycosyltransferase involved in cell wall biosynthesis
MINEVIPKLIIGIDATNLRGGGGVTHILELLNAAEPAKHGVAKVIIWGGAKMLAKLPDRAWLEKVNPPALNRGFFTRTLWQLCALSSAAREVQCDVLFVPGGSYAGSFKPIVTMSQNLLPFEWSELRRYRFRLKGLKLLVLRFMQSYSFKGSDGVIFLTEYAKQVVLKVTGLLNAKTVIIAHGLSPQFQMSLKIQKPIKEYSVSNPFRLIYVSAIDQYKHQWHLIEAVHTLRVHGLPIELKLIGPAYPPSLARLQSVITKFDPEKLWVHYHGDAPYESLHALYAQADLAVFASSCENMPIILLESMASGLPVACSNRGPMSEILGETGLYFDPENSEEISRCLRKYIDSPALRNKKASSSIIRCQQYSWERCADETFEFLAKVACGKIK